MHKALGVIGMIGSLVLASSGPAQDKNVDYARFGREYLKSLSEPTPPPISDLLERHFVRLDLGIFDLRAPPTCAELPAIAAALLDLQGIVLSIVEKDQKALKAELADIALLKRFVLEKRAAEAASRPATRDLLVVNGAKDDARAASKRLSELMRSGKAVGLVRERPLASTVVLAPTRKDYVAFVGWLGLAIPEYQPIYWHDTTAQWTDLVLMDEGNVQVIALEYAAPQQNGDVTLGFAMNTREKTGLLQHVVQRATLSLLWTLFGKDAEGSILAGLAQDLVIDLLGQNNARSGGSGQMKSTDGQGGFIPGAPGAGGGMPMMSADSAWRNTFGSDYFVRSLRQAQHQGERESPASKDRTGHFLLHDSSGNKKFVVTAPFFGSKAMDKEILPQPFLDDYLEFHRAYRSCFVHWLQTNGTGKGKAQSIERLGELLRRSAASTLATSPGSSLEGLCRDVYGVPLSESDPTADTLERRFLRWLHDST